VIADDRDDRRPGAPGVVQVGEPVGHPGPEVQEHHGGAAGHAGVAVGGAGGHALEQREHAAHLGDLVERADEVHLRGAGVGEADGDPRVGEGLDERACTVHRADSAAGSLLRHRFATSSASSR